MSFGSMSRPEIGLFMLPIFPFPILIHVPRKTVSSMMMIIIISHISMILTICEPFIVAFVLSR